LDITVFQDAPGQAVGGLDTALALARGEDVARLITIPFKLVTPENMHLFMSEN